MKQTRQLLDTLKRQIRAAGLTYRDLAGHLGLSEASVKRLFSERSFSLARLEQTCDLLGLELGELILQSREERKRVEALNEDQEAEIAGDTLLLLIAISVINGFTYDDLIDYYRLSEHECLRKLVRLDQLKLIDLLPGNRIRLRVAPNFRWRAGGPIQQYFQERVQQAFFDSRFTGADEKLLVLNGVLSDASNRRLQDMMEKVYEEFDQLMTEDAARPLPERKGNILVMALRQWQYPPFKRYMR